MKHYCKIIRRTIIEKYSRKRATENFLINYFDGIETFYPADNYHVFYLLKNSDVFCQIDTENYRILFNNFITNKIAFLIELEGNAYAPEWFLRGLLNKYCEFKYEPPSLKESFNYSRNIDLNGYRFVWNSQFGSHLIMQFFHSKKIRTVSST